jgi:hypothetical protein
MKPSKPIYELEESIDADWVVFAAVDDLAVVFPLLMPLPMLLSLTQAKTFKLFKNKNFCIFQKPVLSTWF